MIDTLGEHERFGLRRLKRVLREHAGQPPEVLLSGSRPNSASRSARPPMTPRPWPSALRR